MYTTPAVLYWCCGGISPDVSVAKFIVTREPRISTVRSTHIWHMVADRQKLPTNVQPRKQQPQQYDNNLKLEIAR